MTTLKLLDGEVEDPRDTRIAELEDELRDVRNEVARANSAALQAKRDATRALGTLRRQLGPLYRALQDVFGELDAAGIEDSAPSASSTTGNTRTSAVWESWKSRLPGGPAKIIDALMLHGEMNTQQLAIATGVHRNSIPAMIYKLNKAGLLNKNGGRFSLKPL
jgi:hypothetical protein